MQGNRPAVMACHAVEPFVEAVADTQSPSGSARTDTLTILTWLRCEPLLMYSNGADKQHKNRSCTKRQRM